MRTFVLKWSGGRIGKWVEMAAVAPEEPIKSILTALHYERLRRMVAWLLAHEEEIASLEKIQVSFVFDCAGKTIQATTKKVETIQARYGGGGVI